MTIPLTMEMEIEKDNKGNTLAEVSTYQPSAAARQRIAEVRQHLIYANILKNKPYLEFNGYSLLQRISLDQMSFNQFVEATSEDPAEAWRSKAFRPIVRNKIIALAAQITASIIYPKIYAEDEHSDEDQQAASVMRDIMEWVSHRSNYDKTFLYAVLDALVMPATFIYTEYAERYRKIKEIQADGSWTVKEVLDEVFSGFQDYVVPCDEMWIANIYEPELQKQPYIVWRRIIDFETAKAKYQGNKIFDEHVRPGVRFLYSNEQNLFYRQYDASLQGRLVEELVYWNRDADLKLTFINGMLIDDPDQPNPRLDKMYPFAVTGYERINKRFFYFKSLAFKLAPDEEVLNTAYRMFADGTYLQTMPPAVVFGNEMITSSIIAPGVVTTIANDQNPNASFQTIQTNNNLNATFNLIQKVESSINESSVSEAASGMSPVGAQTAFEVSRMEQNARVMLGLFGKMIGFLVRDFGMLRISDIIQHMTVGQINDIGGKENPLVFRKFVLPERTHNGKRKSRKIEFDANLPTGMVEQSDILKLSRDIAEEEVKAKEKMQLIKVNPEIFRKLKYYVMVSPEPVLPKSDALAKAQKIEEYSIAIQNPLVDAEAITRDLLLASFETTSADIEKYMKKQPQETAIPAPRGMGNASEQNIIQREAEKQMQAAPIKAPVSPTLP